MSYCTEDGKDRVVFLTKEDNEEASAELQKAYSGDDDDDDYDAGAVFPNGDINWGCPCFGGMSTGPCGVEFREAFTCFVRSEEEPKGSECIDKFREMSECLGRYPELYSRSDDDEDGDEGDNSVDVDAIAAATSASMEKSSDGSAAAGNTGS